jgi:hypothetical protein
MVKGTAPYNTSSISTFELQTKIVNEPLALTNTIWDAIIQKSTAKLPTDRYAEMNRLILAVQNIGIKESNSGRKKVTQEVEKKPIAELLKSGIKGNVVFETMYYVVLLSILGLADAVIYKGAEASWLTFIQLILTIRVLYGFNQYLVKYLDFKKSTFSTYIFMSTLLVFPFFYVVGKGMGFSKYGTLSSGQTFFLIAGFLYGIVFIYASFRLFINLFLVKGPGIIYFRTIGAFVFVSILAIVVVIIATKGNLPTEPISGLDYLFMLIFDGVLFMGFWEAYKAFGSVKKSA